MNEKLIIYIDDNGKYWIGLNSLSNALKVDSSRSYKNAKKDPIIGPALAIQPVQVPGKTGIQLRNVTCIPEKYVYGWLFSINSESSQLLEYKKVCYELLFEHFHGTIINRKELLLQREEIDTKIHHLKQDLKEEAEKFKNLGELQTKRKLLTQQLNTIDKELVKEPELFSDEYSSQESNG